MKFCVFAPTHGLTTRKSKQAMWIQTFWWIWAMLMDSLAILVPWLGKYWGGLQAFAAWTRERAGETWGQQKDLLQKALEKLRHDGHTESLATWSWLCYYLDVFGHFFADIFAFFCIISNSLDRQWSTQNVSQTFYRFQTAMNQQRFIRWPCFHWGDFVDQPWQRLGQYGKSR